MLVSTVNMPGDSRVWIYQSGRMFTPDEEKKTTSLANEFLSSWTAHDLDLKAGFEIRYHVFLILMIDEKQALASGCSIDKSVHFIQKLEKEFSVELMNRNIFALKVNDKITLLKKDEFILMNERGDIPGSSIVFNNLIQTKNELDSKWEIPFKESWYKNVLI